MVVVLEVRAEEVQCEKSGYEEQVVDLQAMVKFKCLILWWRTLAYEVVSLSVLRGWISAAVEWQVPFIEREY